MVTLNNFIHPKKNVKEKYEFFADSIENVTDIIGKTPNHPIENHLSLLEKIKFQFDNNYESYQNKYVKNYLRNRLFSNNDFYLNSRKGNSLKSLLQNKNNFDDLKKAISKEISYQAKSMLKNYVLEVGNIIANDSISPKSSRNSIEYYSNLIVSEYIFEGFTRKDIHNIPNLILSGKTRDGNRPNCFVKKSNWRKANARTQLLRIQKLCYSEKLSLQYTFRIKNIICKDNFYYKYNNVTIVGNQSKILQKVIPKRYREEFINYTGAFSIQTIKTNSLYSGFDKSKAEVSKTLDFLNVVHTGHASLDMDNYHIYNLDVNQGQKNWKNLNTFLTEKKTESRKDQFDIEAIFPKQLSTKRIQELLLLDKLFYKARQEPDLEEKTVIFWRYLESLFNYHSKKSAKVSEKSEYIIKRISRILITREFQNFYNLVTVGLLNTAMNFPSRQNLTTKDVYRDYLINNRHFNFEAYKTSNFAKKHLFLSREIDKVTKYKKTVELTKAYEYYTTTLKESYELRNFSVHSGKTFEKSIIKAGLTLEIVVTRIRSILIETLNKSEFKRLQLKTIIEKLSIHGLSLLQNEQKSD